uniref:DNA replication complex GINS protein PSF2 n=1 Tax=Aceria tosichella TaxID=561515 RepID=A0A6G1S4N0_9ACAR
MDFCEFLGEDELIEIVPSFSYGLLNLIKGDFGPFIPGTPTRVPVWMALNLYRQQKCKINLPQWLLDLGSLLEEQKNSPNLIKMPCDHWREVVKLLASHNVPMPHEQINALVERREAILRKSIDSLLDQVVNLDEDQISQVLIKNITKFELTTLKRVILPNLAVSKNIQKFQ